MNIILLYRHKCFTGKYATHKIHTKLHPGLEWRIFHIRTSEDTMISLTSSLYLNLLVYDRNIFGSASKVFGNLRKFSENVRERSSGLWKYFGKSSESGRKSSENRQKRRHQYVYILIRTLHPTSEPSAVPVLTLTSQLQIHHQEDKLRSQGISRALQITLFIAFLAVNAPEKSTSGRQDAD